MLTKQIFHQLLKRIRHGAITVTYSDGTTEKYGKGLPYNHITLKSPKPLRAMLRNMSIGFGESYMNGEIVVEGSLTGIVRLLGENTAIFSKLSLNNVTRFSAANSKRHQKKNIQHHYDLGNDFYRLWLDKSMTYTCAYYKNTKNSLETAQQQKITHVLHKLQLKKGQRLLDIGSGWGTLLITAAKDYGVQGYGVTLSEEQYVYAKKAAKLANVADFVTFELCNYQDLAKRNMAFDRIVSVGMLEAVGRKGLGAYFKVVEKMLVPGGLSVLHTITQEHEAKNDPWIDKYIFPGGYAPTYREIVKLFPKNNFRFIDYENLRMHYVLTLEEWLRRFEAHKAQVIDMYDERFYRMWELYLACSASTFRYWDLSLSQFVFTKGLRNDLPLTRAFLYE